MVKLAVDSCRNLGTVRGKSYPRSMQLCLRTPEVQILVNSTDDSGENLGPGLGARCLQRPMFLVQHAATAAPMGDQNP